MTMIPHRDGWVLGLILVLALGLRVYGIHFGLPYAYHVDEPTYVSAALNLGGGVIGRQPNPTGFSNILFVEYGAYFVVGRLLGWFSSVSEFEAAYRANSAVFLLLSRLTSAVLGALTVLAVYWMAREVSGRATAALAGLFLAVSFLHVRDSHYGVPDIAVTYFVVLTVALCAAAASRNSTRYLCAGAASAGFALATKWSVLPVILPVVVGGLVIARRRNPVGWALPLARLAAAGTAFAVAGFLVGGAQLLLQPMTYIEYALREARAGEHGGFSVWLIDTVPGWLFYGKTLAYGVGIPLLTLAAAGAVRRLAMAFRDPEQGGLSVLVLAFPAVYFGLMGMTRHYFARYALLLVPFICLLAAEAASSAAAWAGRNGRTWRPAVLVAAAAIVVMSMLPRDLRHGQILSRVDTRTLAKDWIEANLPEATRIASDWDIHGPPLSTPGKPRPFSRRQYDLVLIGETGLSEQPLSWYRDNKFEYLIASSFIYDLRLAIPDADAARKAFYETLDRTLETVAVFRPRSAPGEPPFMFDEIYGPAISLWQRDRPGPTIKIYRVGVALGEAKQLRPLVEPLD